MKPVPYTNNLFVNEAGQFFKHTDDGYEDVAVDRSLTGHPTVMAERFKWGHRKPCHAAELVLLTYGIRPPLNSNCTIQYLDGNFLNLSLANLVWRDNNPIIKSTMRRAMFNDRFAKRTILEDA